MSRAERTEILLKLFELWHGVAGVKWISDVMLEKAEEPVMSRTKPLRDVPAGNLPGHNSRQ